MGLMDSLKKMNMATSGDPMAPYIAGLESLGLKSTSQQGANSKLEGTFEGKQVKMSIDGGQVMKAGKIGLWGTAAAILKEFTGIDLHPDRHWEKDEDRDFEAKERMQNAQMVFKWSLMPQNSVSGNITVGRDKKLGQEIAKRLYVNGSPELVEALKKPEILSLLERANFDEVSVRNGILHAYWAPPMSEYQKVAATPENFTNVTREALTILSKLCDEYSA